MCFRNVSVKFLVKAGPLIWNFWYFPSLLRASWWSSSGITVGLDWYTLSTDARSREPICRSCQGAYIMNFHRADSFTFTFPSINFCSLEQLLCLKSKHPLILRPIQYIIYSWEGQWKCAGRQVARHSPVWLPENESDSLANYSTFNMHCLDLSS